MARGIAEKSEAMRLDQLAHERLDRFTHARLWNNPCGFAARFNFIAMRYNVPLYGWVEQEFGLSRVEFVVIYSLAIMDGVTASEIAASTAFPKNTLSRAVNRLVELKLIRRRTDAADRRNQPLAISAAGRAIVKRAMPRFVALEGEMLSALSPQERDLLSGLMAKIVMAMVSGQVGVEATPNEKAA
ncbi:MAG: MarR family winged helix-turn-helix transcriptional regulator [Beijerinckiaceae bacterium]